MDYTLPEFEVDHDGVHFVVLLFADCVVKLPRKRPKVDQKLDEIAEMQNKLAAVEPTVLPVENRGDYLLMPRAPGERVDKLQARDKALDAHLQRLRSEAVARIEALGYDMRDASPKNMFYCRKTDRLYLVDFHLVTERERSREDKRRRAETRQKEKADRRRELTNRAKRGR